MLRAVASVLDPVMSALDRVDLEDLAVVELDVGQPPEHVAGADVIHDASAGRVLVETARAVRYGELDPEKLLTATLERIEERNSALRAVAATFPRESMAMLASAPRGRLYGVPVTMKDMYSLPWRGYRNGTVRELGRPSASGGVSSVA